MSQQGFSFAQGNLAKLAAAPLYALGWLLSLLVPRSNSRWIFGSGIGVAEGALAVARELARSSSSEQIAWAVSSDAEADAARAEGFSPVRRSSVAGFWATLRAGRIVITHGFGDVNRYAVFGARTVHLGHGAPLKLLHLDAPVTTRITGPAPVRALLRRMYLAGTRRVSMYVAGSPTAAARLRSAYRVAPGVVRVLGDPRDDALAAAVHDPARAQAARDDIRARIGLEIANATADGPWILYAPTWRDGDDDPGVPTPAESAAITADMERLGARLFIRSHPLGVGAYDHALGDRVHLLGSAELRDVTPVLCAFDAVITDYSSLAIDFSLLGRPIVWFAPDLVKYTASRGLYEPLQVTSANHVCTDWNAALRRLDAVIEHGRPAQLLAEADARDLAARFHAFPGGGAAARVLAEVRALDDPLALDDPVKLNDPVALGGAGVLGGTAGQQQPGTSVFFESFYGRQIGCNPRALDREIAARFPAVRRYWSVISETQSVPDGAIPVLVGGPAWFAARRLADVLIVNDWLRYDFTPRRGQLVVQTWHGTPLKRLALSRPRVGLRTRLAIRRESRRWGLLLSPNPHTTEQLTRSYAYRGEVLETGYPRNDELARAAVGGERIEQFVHSARRELGVPDGAKVLVYAPTWREPGRAAAPGSAASGSAALDTAALANELGADWVILVRSHTRAAPLVHAGGHERVVDVSAHDDVNDVLLAADVLVTDYSSVMFDAAVARGPIAFYVPDLAEYRDRERGFTFDFESEAPGPLFTERAALVEYVSSGAFAMSPSTAAYARWVERFAPFDDGFAAERVVDRLSDALVRTQ